MENTIVEETQTVTKEITKVPAKVDTVTVKEVETVRSEVVPMMTGGDVVVVEATETVVSDVPAFGEPMNRKVSKFVPSMT